MVVVCHCDLEMKIGEKVISHNVSLIPDGVLEGPLGKFHRRQPDSGNLIVRDGDMVQETLKISDAELFESKKLQKYCVLL
jgi:hypothetical protein